ncbi:MAG: hypothetical protein KDB53_19600, partial [Planctomycetes bacterium]|nr:hypothetical protein [Planctomycetota bacterium]
MSHRVALALTLIVTGLAWKPILDCGFLTDDYQVISIAADWLDLEAGLSVDNLKRLAGAYAGPVTDRYELLRPSVLVSFGLNLLTTGTHPLPFLITNGVLHLISTVLLWGLIRRLSPELSAPLTALATALFAVSPLHAEALAWSAARSDLLSLLLGLTGLHLVLSGRVWWSLLPLFLAFTAKESALS